MELTISGNTTIGELNKEFQKDFWYLRLDFSIRSPESGLPCFLDEPLPESVRLSQLNSRINPGFIRISSSDTVAALQQRFRNFFGLGIRVCRRTVESWARIGESENLPLGRQNDLAKNTFRPRYNFHTLFL